MKIAGIVAEYNPFHLGHEYHIRKTREQIGECAIVCVMSGDFVQRGEPALFSKYARAEAACRCGADLVIELPLPWALASAERFAAGAAGLLADIGADYIAFGSETGDVRAIEDTAGILRGENYASALKDVLKEEPEISFAAAREKALLKAGGINCAEIAGRANDSLAAEYLKAIKCCGFSMRPIAVKREGNGHDEHGGEGLLSASEIRKRYAGGENISAFLPESASEVFANEINAGRMVDWTLFETAALARLRGFDREYFNSLPDSKDGLGDRLFKASRSSAGLDELYFAVKTKKYAMSRIRRVTMCALLGIEEGMSKGRVPYIRVLAANEKGCGLLRKISDAGKTPLITKPAEINKYDKKLQHLFAVGVYAADILTLCYAEKSERRGGKEWRISPKIVKDE